MEQLENVIINIMTTFVAYSKMVTRSQIDFSAEVITQFSKGYQIPILFKNGSIQYITIFQLLSCSLCSNFFSSVHTQQSFSSAAMWQAFGKEEDKKTTVTDDSCSSFHLLFTLWTPSVFPFFHCMSSYCIQLAHKRRLYEL